MTLEGSHRPPREAATSLLAAEGVEQTCVESRSRSSAAYWAEGHTEWREV